jgi:hypothetical protein
VFDDLTPRDAIAAILGIEDKEVRHVHLRIHCGKRLLLTVGGTVVADADGGLVTEAAAFWLHGCRPTVWVANS